MVKTSRNDLAKEVQTELITYLGSGKPLNQRVLAEALDITELNISDFSRLKRIRFALSADVQAYLEVLDERLRSIRTTTAVETTRVNGEIRGSIDWGQTVRERYSRNPGDRTQYVTRTPYTEYQLPENILIKKLLGILASTARNDLTAIAQDWRSDRWSDQSIRKFLRLYDRNIHLNRIETDGSRELRPRDLDAARQSRQPLYFQGYELYVRYQKLRDNEFDSPEVRDLLYESVVMPDVDTLFELVCIFRLIRKLRDGLDVTHHPIEPGSGALAQLENDEIVIQVYHDAGGSLQFSERAPESPQDRYLQKYRTVVESHKSFMDHQTERGIWSGRPDIILEVYSKQEGTLRPVHVTIGEVKHTDDRSTLSDGVFELFEYLQYAQPHPRKGRRWPIDNYLLDSDAVSLNGLVFTEQMDQTNHSRLVKHVVPENIANASIATLFGK